MYLITLSVPWWDLRVFYREIIPIFFFLEATWLNCYNIIFHFSHLLCNQLHLDLCKDKISISWFLLPVSITHTCKQVSHPYPKSGGWVFPTPKAFASFSNIFPKPSDPPNRDNIPQVFYEYTSIFIFRKTKGDNSQCWNHLWCSACAFPHQNLFMGIPVSFSWIPTCPSWTLHFNKQCSAVHSWQSIESLSSLAWICSQEEKGWATLGQFLLVVPCSMLQLLINTPCHVAVDTHIRGVLLLFKIVSSNLLTAIVCWTSWKNL